MVAVMREQTGHYTIDNSATTRASDSRISVLNTCLSLPLTYLTLDIYEWRLRRGKWTVTQLQRRQTSLCCVLAREREREKWGEMSGYLFRRPCDGMSLARTRLTERERRARITTTAQPHYTAAVLKQDHNNVAQCCEPDW